MRGKKREHILGSLTVQFSLAAIGFAIFALQSPPEFVSSAFTYFGFGNTASIIWAAAISIVAAFFGANAHAANKAFQQEGPSI